MLRGMAGQAGTFSSLIKENMTYVMNDRGCLSGHEPVTGVVENHPHIP
jgi:hypothetical protein